MYLSEHRFGRPAFGENGAETAPQRVAKFFRGMLWIFGPIHHLPRSLRSVVGRHRVDRVPAARMKEESRRVAVAAEKRLDEFERIGDVPKRPAIERDEPDALVFGHDGRADRVSRAAGRVGVDPLDAPVSVGLRLDRAGVPLG